MAVRAQMIKTTIALLFIILFGEWSIAHTAYDDATSDAHPPASVEATKERPVRLELRVSESEVVPGSTFELELRMNIRAGFEIHTLGAPPPSIATKLDCSLPSGMEFQGEWSLPAAAPSLRPDGHDGYQGEVRFRRSVQVAPDATPGQHRIECKAFFQACDDKLCFRPVTVPLSIAITVVESSSMKEGQASSAQEIVNALLDHYRNLKTYQDIGNVKIVFIKDDQEPRTENQPFKTAWAHPDRFRYEYSGRARLGRENRYIVWMNGTDVQSHWTLKGGPKSPESLGRALAGATGVSGGSASLVPSLLLPDSIGWGPIPQLQNLKQIEDAETGSYSCRRITGELDGAIYTLWIDKEELLLHRVDIQRTFEDFRSETEITLEPQLNKPVPDEALEFKSK